MSEPSLTAAVCDSITSARDSVVSSLESLLAIPSIGGTDDEVAIQHLVADWLEADGLEVTRWDIDVDAVLADPEFPGQEVDRSAALGVIARLPGRGSGPTLLLNGHTDVVPSGDPAQWTSAAFEPRRDVRDGCEVIVARGANDMKAGLMAAMLAVRALRDADVLAGDIVLTPVCGEEDGGFGTFSLLRHGIHADACLVPEPTDLDLVPANGGALTFRLIVHGHATHASRRTEGVSAIEKFIPLFAALEELEARRCANPDPLMARWPLAYPLSIGTIRAGDWASSVPDLLVAEGRLGVALGESVEHARRDLEQAVAEACAKDPWLRGHPAEVEWWGGQFAPGRSDPDHPFVDAVRRAHLEAGGHREADMYGGPYGSDLRLLHGLAGIPTLQYGPGDARYAHGPDEWVAVDDILTCARAIALTAMEFCGTR